jgi:hypothetical protein
LILQPTVDTLLGDDGGACLASRTRLALERTRRIPRPVTPPGDAAVVAIFEIGSLHHRYERRAA